MNDSFDTFWMERAYQLAQQAAISGEVPVGAVLVSGSQVVAEAYNLKETRTQATAHAELLVIEQACAKLGRWRLLDCTLYVTLEPCLMCVGAIVQARLARVVFATPDPKAGAICSAYRIFEDNKLNHRPHVDSGVLQTKCSELLKEFFRGLRERNSTVRRPMEM